MTKSNAQIFHELTGGCWHEWTRRKKYKTIFGHYHTTNRGRKCKKCGIAYNTRYKRPTYSNAADILLRMKEFCGEKKYLDFISTVGNWTYTNVSGGLNIFINEKYINPSLLLEKAIEFLKENI